MTTVTIIPVLQDNYSYLLESPNHGPTAIIDPGQAGPIELFLDKHKIKLDFILNTHHHGDHVSGNEALKKKYGATILGPEKETSRIPGIDKGLKEGDTFMLGEEKIEILETPGHTSGAICFHLKNSGIVFTGDTLFSLGCGRLFEGTPEQMHKSLQKIAALSDHTLIYCGHEYTKANANFCAHITPDNPALQNRILEINTLRASGKPTLPVDIGTEKATNVFLMAKDSNDFARLRRLKDSF
ncbi:MAG: hydroxyacylglutathione hydrolase [Alphaproteobacteria bacterium]|nr:hydroxyacylglutathione hydrolase [Alphaproteobacteria bacterium]